MSDVKATMYVFAGNNGSGKSTIRNLLIDRIGLSVNIDSDALARRINPEDPEKARVTAGKSAIRLAHECIERHRDFSIETTLSGNYAIRLMKQAKQHGFEISMFYVGLGDPKLNIERVAIRVRNGGHHIPTSDIMHRHQSSIQNLLLHLDIIDVFTVIDNSTIGGEVVLQIECGNMKYKSAILPKWVTRIEKRLERN